MDASSPLRESQRLVLDTNAALDWLMFRDRQFQSIAAAIEARQLQLFTDAACLEELHRVLQYTKFGLDEARRAELSAKYQAHVTMWPPGHNEGSALRVPLPMCSDPDDQKFIDLAHRTQAILVTKDKALLRLRRAAKAINLAIMHPDHFTEKLREPAT
ncbi:MAG TPA: putative toxin-antitoxin system toxin component, PIN family [Burkholderiales bacterium]|nr:putative toxin-antitoxin system toxin component, PIN family [Burkholderiales bacterium]